MLVVSCIISGISVGLASAVVHISQSEVTTPYDPKSYSFAGKNGRIELSYLEYKVICYLLAL